MDSKSITLKISNAVIEGGELWASCDEFNGLLCADMGSGKAKIVNIFPRMPFLTRYAFGCVVKVNEILVFVPKMADTVYTYHIKKKEFQLYDLPEEMTQISGKEKFNQAVVYEKCVFMFGYSEPCIVCFDVQEGHITYYEDWYQDFVQKGFEHEILLFDSEVCIVEDRIFFPPRNGDCIIEFDMGKRKCSFHSFNYKKDWYFSLYYADGFFWTCGAKNRTIIRMNDKFEVLEELSLMEIEPKLKNSPLMEGDAYFRFSYKHWGFIWLFSDRYAKYIRVDIEKRKICIYSYNDEEEDGLFSFVNMKCVQSKVYIFEPLRKKLYIYNERMEKMKTLCLETNQNDIFRFLIVEVKEHFFYEREEYTNLYYLIWHIQNSNYSYGKSGKEMGCGAEILRLCKQDIFI